jgi:hypothetical protein
MVVRFALLALALAFALGSGNLMHAQVNSTGNSKEEQQSHPVAANWTVGFWQVTSAKVVENGESADIKNKHQDLLLFTEKLEIEIYLPDAERHSPMSALGTEIYFSGKDKSGTQYFRSTFESEGRMKFVKFTIEPKNQKKTRAVVAFLHRRDNGNEWKYQLEIAKIDDEKRLSEIATMTKPFLDGTADIQVFGQRGLHDGLQKTEEIYSRAIREWLNHTPHQHSK